MPESVNDRLATYAIDLIAHQWMQATGRSLGHHAVSDLLLRRVLLDNLREHLLQVQRIPMQSQAADGIAAFLYHPAHQFKNPA